jgi:hypothetical protein
VQGEGAKPISQVFSRIVGATKGHRFDRFVVLSAA